MLRPKSAHLSEDQETSRIPEMVPLNAHCIFIYLFNSLSRCFLYIFFYKVYCFYSHLTSSHLFHHIFTAHARQHAPPNPTMIADLILTLCITWFLLIFSTCLTLVYRTLSMPIATNYYRAVPEVVAIFYLAFVALTAQDCFFPGRTPSIFKIVSAGPDRIVEKGKEGRASVPVMKVR